MPEQSDPDAWDATRLASEVAFTTNPTGRQRREPREIAFALEIARAWNEIKQLRDQQTDREKILEEALQVIADWGDPYPTTVFPEPDDEYYERAHRVLTENGMTLDRLSAANMRHIVTRVAKIAKEALKDG